MTDNRGLLIWGASGHGKVVLECALAMSPLRACAFIDDAYTGDGQFFGMPVLGNRSRLTPAIFRQYPHIVIAIGDNTRRAACFAAALSFGFSLATIIHPSAIVSTSAILGLGSVVVPGASIGADTRIGLNCIVNTAASVDRDCRIGNHVHLSPQVGIARESVVGDYTHIGIGAVTSRKSIIGAHTVVGAGTVLSREVPSYVTVVGVPARIVKQSTAELFAPGPRYHTK